ncbi:hypothetical protein HYV73_03305 [Candidatus Uhrbacteria bacterium]|nr:hypothetical protein [Candidatus Uhrbacteria bacterium]
MTMLNVIETSSWKTNIARVLVAAMLVSLVAYASPASAAQFTAVKDTMTRLKISTNADHTILLTLPAATTFDVSGSTDVLIYDFPQTAAFTQSGTWATADFTFNDGTARTVNAVSAGAGTTTVACADGANNVGVAIDTTAIAFRVIPCGASYTASGAAAIVTFTIDGTSADGELINPATAGSYTLNFSMDDEGTSAAHAATDSVAIVEEDTVTITASVDASLTFDIDVGITHTETNPATVPVALGTLTSSAVSSSGGSINSIWFDIATNATDGFVVTVINTDTVIDLASASVPGDTITSAATALVAGTEGYGICIVSTSATTGTILMDGDYDGDVSADGCTAGAGDHTVGVTPSSSSAAEPIFTAAGPVAGGEARVAVKAAISGATEAHTDYTDAMRFIATATF